MQPPEQHASHQVKDDNSAPVYFVEKQDRQYMPQVTRGRSFDFYESMIWSMVRGAVRFPVIRLPQILLTWFADTRWPLARVLRLLLLLMALSIIVFGPVGYAWYVEPINNYFRDRGYHLILSRVEGHAGWVKSICLAWTILATYGSIRAARFFFVRIRQLEDDPYSSF